MIGRVMMGRFRGSHLLETIQPLRVIFDRHRGDIGLVRGLPYIPGDPRGPPFVGSWGTFALEVHVEDSKGRLSRLF